MPDGSVLQLGSLKIPALALGFGGSVAIHAAFLGGLYAAAAHDAVQDRTAPDSQFSRGAPFQIRLIEQDPFETRPEQNAPVHEPTLSMLNLIDSVYARERYVAPVFESDPSRPGYSQLGQKIREQDAHTEAVPPPDWCVTLLETIERTVVRFASVQDQRRTASVAPVRDISVSPSSVHPSLPPAIDVRVDPLPPINPRVRLETQPAERSNGSQRQPQRAGIEHGAEADHLPEPVYPQRSIRLGQEGTVLVAIQVRADGSIGAVGIHESSGYRLLDEAALRAGRRSRFTPATLDGKAQDSTVVVPFEFHIR